LVANFASFASAVRLVDFSGGTSDDGIYIDMATPPPSPPNPSGAIVITAGGNPTFLGGITLNTGTWYHIIITRDANTKDVRVYIGDAVASPAQVSTPFTDAGDNLVPVESNAYNISFLKDDGTEESDGQIAKAAVFNKVLSTAQMLERYDNICNANLIVLPVTLKSFNAQKVGKVVELTWVTATELNNLGFEVQRSTDGVNYTAIGFVKGVGNSTTEVTYHFTDDAPLTGKGYYRLKQLNMDNQFKLSAVRWIDFARTIQGLQVYPNPSHSIITIVNLKAGNTLNIFDSFGRLVRSKKATDTQETLPVDQLSSGVYILQVIDATGNKRSIRFTRL